MHVNRLAKIVELARTFGVAEVYFSPSFSLTSDYSITVRTQEDQVRVAYLDNLPEMQAVAEDYQMGDSLDAQGEAVMEIGEELLAAMMTYDHDTIQRVLEKMSISELAALEFWGIRIGTKADILIREKMAQGAIALAAKDN